MVSNAVAELFIAQLGHLARALETPAEFAGRPSC
jgi:hypothetical protein